MSDSNSNNDRIGRLQEEVREAGIDLLVLAPSPSLTYLTGHAFDAHERLFLLFIPATGAPAAILPELEEHNWKSSVPVVQTVFLWDDKDGPGVAAAAACASFAATKVGIEPLGLRYMEYSVLAANLPDAEFVDAQATVNALRQYKDAEEAESIRRAARIAEESLEEVLALVRVGMTEREISAQLCSRLLGKGGEGISFGPIILGGPKSALPHGVPDNRPLGNGEFLLIDYGTSYNGYHCDITRTFVVGSEPSDQMRQVYEAVLAGNIAGCAATNAAATSHEVHTAAQAPLQDPAFDGYFKHRTGHGLGIDIHEPPSVMEGNHDPLGIGSVITVEPGLYLEGWGGVRIEDDLWVQEDGAEILTSFDKALRIVGT